MKAEPLLRYTFFNTVISRKQSAILAAFKGKNTIGHHTGILLSVFPVRWHLKY